MGAHCGGEFPNRIHTKNNVQKKDVVIKCTQKCGLRLMLSIRMNYIIRYLLNREIETILIFLNVILCRCNML